MVNVRILIRIIFVIFIANGVNCLGSICDDFDNCCECCDFSQIKEFEEVGDYSQIEIIDFVNADWLDNIPKEHIIKIFKKKEANSISSTVRKNNISIKLVGEDSSKIEVPKLEKSRDPLKMEGRRYAFFKIKTEKGKTVYLYCNNVESYSDGKSYVGVFSNMKHKEISVIACDTECVDDMRYMFYNCNNLENLNLSKLNTKEVLYMDSMFDRCRNLKKLKFGKNFNTSKVESMQNMFCFCFNLEYLDIKNFDTSGVKNMKGMFSWCLRLKKLRIGQNFNMEKVEFFDKMFVGCICFPKEIKEKLDNHQEVVDFFKKN